MRKLVLTGMTVLALAGAGIALARPAAAFMRFADAEVNGINVRATKTLAMMHYSYFAENDGSGADCHANRAA